MNALAHNKFEWSRIVQLRTMPTLTDFCPDALHLFENYYQIGPTEYVRASRAWMDGNFTETLVINSIYWASTLAAFRRLSTRDADILASDDGSVSSLPEVLRIAPHCTSYGTIKDFAFSSGTRSNEIDLFDAKRRWRPDGKGWLCIGSCFFVPRFTYYFRSTLPIPREEQPYAACFDTGDDKHVKRLWTPCD